MLLLVIESIISGILSVLLFPLNAAKGAVETTRKWFDEKIEQGRQMPRRMSVQVYEKVDGKLKFWEKAAMAKRKAQEIYTVAPIPLPQFMRKALDVDSMPVASPTQILELRREKEELKNVTESLKRELSSMSEELTQRIEDLGSELKERDSYIQSLREQLEAKEKSLSRSMSNGAAGGIDKKSPKLVKDLKQECSRLAEEVQDREKKLSLTKLTLLNKDNELSATKEELVKTTEILSALDKLLNGSRKTSLADADSPSELGGEIFNRLVPILKAINSEENEEDESDARIGVLPSIARRLKDGASSLSLEGKNGSEILESLR